MGGVEEGPISIENEVKLAAAGGRVIYGESCYGLIGRVLQQ